MTTINKFALPSTVGFNSVSIGAMMPASIIMLYVLMIFGASPSGTGGGLKSTTFAVLLGIMRSVLKRRSSIRFMKREIGADRVWQASASFIYYCFTLTLALFFLLLLEDAPMETVLFEAISALGTVGLSMGLTGSLTDLGKMIVIVLMIMGRVGVLAFGIALAFRDETRDEEQDNEVVI